MTIYIATGNPGKLAEFIRDSAGSGMEVLSLPGLADMPEPVEDAETFAGNARLKATAYSLLAPGLLVVADDSGLEVDALGGAPGVRSARYAQDHGFGLAALARDDLRAGSPTKDQNNNAFLLKVFRAAKGSNPAARYRCVLALARDGVVLLEAEGAVEGEITLEPRGDRGFGYDPLFFLPELGQTMGELAPEEKWALSHRGRAFRNLRDKLKGGNLP